MDSSLPDAKLRYEASCKTRTRRAKAEHLLFMTNGVQVRDASEGVLGRKRSQAWAMAPASTTCHRCGP